MWSKGERRRWRKGRRRMRKKRRLRRRIRRLRRNRRSGIRRLRKDRRRKRRWTRMRRRRLFSCILTSQISYCTLLVHTGVDSLPRIQGVECSSRE
jgi:hypothetical protein